MIADPAPGPRPPSEAGPLRRILHALVALAGWALFVWWWWLVLRRADPGEMRFTAIFVAATLVACVGITSLWAVHNLEIHRRKGPRTQVRETLYDFSRDRVGRPVRYDGTIESLGGAGIVLVGVSEQGKNYRAAPGFEPRSAPKLASVSRSRLHEPR